MPACLKHPEGTGGSILPSLEFKVTQGTLIESHDLSLVRQLRLMVDYS
jgi:hypothetical protein